MNKSLYKSILLATSAVSAGLMADSTIAQQGRGTSSLEEIIVTASRRTEGLQSIPASIAAVDAAILDQKGISNFSDVTQSIAGLYLAQSNGITNSSLSIRGVGTRGASATDPSVGVVVDGIYQLRPGAVFTELLDISRVEVLRGPQGTNFGKNTTSGVIAIHTADPDTEAFSGRLQGVVGNLDNAEVRGILNVPLVEGRLAARVSGYTARRDGHTKNVFLDEDTRNVDREGGRLKLLWNATDNLSIKLSAEYLNSKMRADQGLVEYGLRGLGTMGTRPYEDWYALLPNSPSPVPPPVSLGRAQQNFGDRTEDTVERYVLNVDWTIPNHILSSITGFEKIDTFLEYDFDFTTLDLFVITSRPETEVFTQELQLTSNLEGPLSYIVGAFYQTEDLVSETRMNGAVVSLSERDVDSQAIFGNVTYDINDRWRIIGGLRWTADEKANVGLTETFREWTYTAKLLYQLDDDKMLYFSHDKGFKSGGINRVAPGGDESLRIWQPEITYNYEVGIKSAWLDNRLRVNAALFHQTYEDYQVTTNVRVGDAPYIIVTNAAEVVSQGLEADFAAVITDRLTLDGSLAWIRSKYDEYQNAPCPTSTWPGCVNGAQDLSNKQLDNAPKLTFNIGAEYRHQLAKNNIEWFARADAAYRSSTNMEGMLINSRQSSYTLYNARLGLEAPDSWRLTLWGNNLTDKKYAMYGVREEGGLMLFQGLTRTYGLTLDWYF